MFLNPNEVPSAFSVMKISAFLAIFTAAIYHALNALAATLTPNLYHTSSAIGNLLDQSKKNQSLVAYPTDLTRDLVPKQLHSHNDYWRSVPFYTALSVGAISIEADVWLVHDVLHVGHELSALTRSRTFDSLYIRPILRELTRMNPKSPFVDETTKNGLFDTLSSQTLYLWVDLKTSADSTLPAVVKALEPLRSPINYLTTYSKNSGVKTGPVTVICTGNTELSQVQEVSPRDYFFDAPLVELSSTYSNITSDVSPIASVKFEKALENSEGKEKKDFRTLMRTGRFTQKQKDTIEKQIEKATSKGIGSRYWDTPGWPIGARDRVWKVLWDSGVELINVDDLEAGAGLLGEGGSRGGVWDM